MTTEKESVLVQAQLGLAQSSCDYPCIMFEKRKHYLIFKTMKYYFRPVIECVGASVKCEGTPVASTLNYTISMRKLGTGWQREIWLNGKMNAQEKGYINIIVLKKYEKLLLKLQL